jgi:hypothetical protein
MAKAKRVRAKKPSNIVQSSNIVPMPKPSRTAYNPDRPLEKNQLIQAQVVHFAEAERQLPPELQTNVDVASIKTEGQASQYIRQVTQAIHKSGGRQAPKVETAP